MGAYNFQQRFAPFVRNGSKRHTIRGKRKHPDRPGDTVHLFTKQRSKDCELLGRSICVKVEDIFISAAQQVFVDGVELNLDEKNALAWCDGFRGGDIRNAFAAMMTFWDGRLPFHGDIIHWSRQLVQREADLVRSRNLRRTA